MTIKILLNFFFSECNSTLSDVLRIRLSVFRICHGSDTIQTGVISNKPNIIYTLVTDEIESALQVFNNPSTSTTESSSQQIRLIGENDMKNTVNFKGKENESKHMLKLYVSSSTHKLTLRSYILQNCKFWNG